MLIVVVTFKLGTAPALQSTEPLKGVGPDLNPQPFAGLYITCQPLNRSTIMGKWLQPPIIIPAGLIIFVIIVALFRNSFDFFDRVGFEGSG